jgi:hypothetical protein
MRYDDTLPAGWARVKIVRAEFQTLGDKRVFVAFGWEIRRQVCGCHGLIGMRLDDNNSCFGVVPCDEHEAHMRRVLDALVNMPPQDREMGQLFAELAEHELA